MNKIFDYMLIPFRLMIQGGVGLYTVAVRLFLSLSIWNKLILLLTVFGVLAVMVPVAAFDILGITYAINNPLSITVIVIVLLFDVSIFFSGIYVFAARMLLALYYLIHFSLIFISGSITRAADYVIAPGFYISIGLMILYLAFSALQYFYIEQA